VSSRPRPVQWLRYAFGLRLPKELREWVRHDLTDADWRLREIVRVAVQCLIPVGIIMFLPGPWTIRVFTAGLLLVGALFVAAAYGEDLRDRRLRQHGLDVPVQEE
jgi:hypothetical protein